MPAAFLVMLVPVAAFLALGPLLGWIGLLAERKWAWWVLVVVYGAWALVLVPRVAGNVAMWGWSGVLLGLLFVLPLFVLLADLPRGWRKPAAVKGDRDSGHETARRPRSRTKRPLTLAAAEGDSDSGHETARRPSRRIKRPLTLVELLIIVAMLGILAAIIAPAVSRARRAGQGAGLPDQGYPAVDKRPPPHSVIFHRAR